MGSAPRITSNTFSSLGLAVLMDGKLDSKEAGEGEREGERVGEYSSGLSGFMMIA